MDNFLFETPAMEPVMYIIEYTTSKNAEVKHVEGKAFAQFLEKNNIVNPIYGEGSFIADFIWGTIKQHSNGEHVIPSSVKCELRYSSGDIIELPQKVIMSKHYTEIIG